jgi:hypothetical protein
VTNQEGEIMRYKTNLSQRGQADTATYRFAQGLGIFSIVLGLLELIWGRWLGRSLGLDGKEHVVRFYGGREILTGIAILASKDPTPWVWGRVAGDALDIGTLAYGYTRDPDDVPGITTALVAVAGATAADIYCAAKLSGESKVPLPPLKDYSDRSGFPNSRPPTNTVVVSDTVVVSL